MNFDVVIIGAGAAGLMCAAQVSKRGRSVLILDHAKKPARKILISGGGKCNFTNYDVSADSYFSQNKHFVKSALTQYTNWDFISLVSNYGIEFEHKEHGRLFCRNGFTAKDIVKMLLQECDEQYVTHQYQCIVNNIVKNDNFFTVQYTNANQQQIKMQSKSLVIATGGLSMPKLGATPFGYKIAQQFKIPVVPTIAALVPFTLQPKDKDILECLSGISVDAVVTTQSGMSFKEALLFTHRGLSGPAILQASLYWQAGEKIAINLAPEINLINFFATELNLHPEQNLKTILTKIFPKKLVEALLIWHKLENKPLKQYSQLDLNKITNQLINLQITPNMTEGYRTAEVTKGGVDTNFLSSKTMEAKNVSGLYFIGEVVDVTGQLGGYNFQWCWSSGFVAGQYV